MKIIGRKMTKEEKENVLKPFLPDKNGIDFDPCKIRDCINEGYKVIENNPDLKEVLEKALHSFHISQ